MNAKKIPDKSNFLEKFSAVESFLQGKVQMLVPSAYAPNTVIKNDPDVLPTNPTSEPDIKCPGCGYSQPPDSKFCRTCGHNLEFHVDVQALNNDVTQVPIVGEPKTYKCSKCSAPHNPDDVFCEECGNKL